LGVAADQIGQGQAGLLGRWVDPAGQRRLDPLSDLVGQQVSSMNWWMIRRRSASGSLATARRAARRSRRVWIERPAPSGHPTGAR
jgi:hypothetical protein